MSPLHYDTIIVRGVAMWRTWLRLPGCSVSILVSARPLTIEGGPA